jgi:hypothetical protein
MRLDFLCSYFTRYSNFIGVEWEKETLVPSPES